MNLQACRMQIRLDLLHKGSCHNYENGNSSSSHNPSPGRIDHSISFTQNPWFGSSYSTAFQTTVLDSRSTREVKLGNPEPQLLPGIDQFITSTTDPTFDIPDTIKVAAFSGDSFIEMPCLKVQLNLYIEVVLASYTNSGVVLYNGQSETGEGDFVAITINQGNQPFVSKRGDILFT